MIAYQQTTPQERGMLRAVVEGVQVRRLPTGDYLASSFSHPGVWHAVHGGRCDCEGFQRTNCCKHVAACELAQQDAPCRRCGAVVPQQHLDSSGTCPACSVDDLFGRD